MTDYGPCRQIEWYEKYPLHKLWANQSFPLFPMFHYRLWDTYNETRVGVHWLFFNIWTLSNFEFGFDINLGFNRFGFGFILPYLRIWIGINHVYTRPTNFLERLFNRSPNYGIFARKTSTKEEQNEKTIERE